MQTGKSPHVISKVIKVPNTGSTGRVSGHAVVDDQWVMLAHIVSVAIRVGVAHPTVSISRHVLLVLSPAYTSLFKEIDDGEDVRRDGLEVVRGQTEKIPTSSGDVVRLTGMGKTVVRGERDTFCRQGLEHGLLCSICIVGVLQPDLDEAVEYMTSHHRS